MAYNDFTLAGLKHQFGLRTDESQDLFAHVSPVAISDRLRETLEENVPLALSISTEKARSELIITPVLMEVRRRFPRRISLFSGVEFNVDPDLGLRGVCDYLFSLSPEQLAIEAPAVVVVEAKNENIKQGIVQCAAEMVGAQRFNRERENDLRTVFGVVTSGSNWKFLRMTEALISIDQTEYYISQVEGIVAILLSILQEASAEQPERQAA